MATSVLSHKKEAVLDAAGVFVEDANSASAHVMSAAKTAGKEVRSVAQEEIARLKSDLDELARSLPTLSDVDFESAKESLMEKIATIRHATNSFAANAREQLGHKVEAAETYVKERPLQSVTVAAGIGILLGMLIARK